MRSFRSGRIGLVATVAFIACGAVATHSANASALDFTGWTNYGASNAQGTWVRFGGVGGSTNPYTIYTKSFFYDGSLGTGVNWSTGDVIVAVGAGGVFGFGPSTSLGATGWKFQLSGFTSANSWTAGDVATNTAGKGSFGALGADGAGSFTLQSNNAGDNLGRLTVMQGDGTTLANTAANAASIPMFALRGDSSMQLFLNLTTIQQYSVTVGTGLIPAFGSEVKTIFYPRDGTLSESLVTIALPQAIPGSGLAAIGTLGLAGVARRRRS